MQTAASHSDARRGRGSPGAPVSNGAASTCDFAGCGELAIVALRFDSPQAAIRERRGEVQTFAVYCEPHAGEVERLFFTKDRKLVDELLSQAAAGRLAGVDSTMVSKWVRTGVIPARGRGPRNAILVSRADVVAAVRWRSRSIGSMEAARLLATDWHRVIRLCESGALPYRRFGRNYAIDRAAVERLAAEQRRDRERLITIQEAARRTPLPRHVWRRLVRNGQLATHPGEHGARTGQARGFRLVSRSDVERLAAELSRPRPCPACGKPLPPGNEYHSGTCTGVAAAEGSRAYWRSVRAERDACAPTSGASG